MAVSLPENKDERKRVIVAAARGDADNAKFTSSDGTERVLASKDLIKQDALKKRLGDR